MKDYLKKIKKITNNKKMVADANSRLDKINYEKEFMCKWRSYY